MHSAILIQPMFRVTPETFDAVHVVPAHWSAFLFSDDHMVASHRKLPVRLIIVRKVQRPRLRLAFHFPHDGLVFPIRNDRDPHLPVSFENAEHQHLSRRTPAPFPLTASSKGRFVNFKVAQERFKAFFFLRHAPPCASEESLRRSVRARQSEPRSEYGNAKREVFQKLSLRRFAHAVRSPYAPLAREPIPASSTLSSAVKELPQTAASALRTSYSHDTIVSSLVRNDYWLPFLKGHLTLGYAEAKDIDEDLDKVEKGEQMGRYYGYSNLILTNYIEFRFFRNGEKWCEPIKIADYSGGVITPRPQSLEEIENTLRDFLSTKPEAVKSGKLLAEIMGGKARRIRDNVRHYLAAKTEKNKELEKVYETIHTLLVHDITPEAFADMYAQTLVYGLFVARHNDESPETFSREEARDLIPPSNPFLRHFFDHIVGPNFDTRLAYIVNELCDVFALADVHMLMSQYFKTSDLWGKTHEGPDPVIHFYEDFLREYDPALRKEIGAYYTPLPVVRFIIRAVDYLLEEEFCLAGGLSDTAKTTLNVHKVQILDPAVGTGTFLNETILAIHTRFRNQQGRWPSYVHHDLLPRLHGFELFMAPYTIAHLKLSITLKETGFFYFNKTKEGDTRLGIYLTNSLEESATHEHSLYAFGLAQSIAEEGKEAAKIKNEKPIMVVIGNPPYSGESSNPSYTDNDVYKIEPTGGQLQERNSKWLNDDYVKFIRLAEHFIEKNGSGIVAMITAHGYLDNPTFRGMRWHLMHTFDEIYVLDLHGNANKKEKDPDGSDDKNVFDIKQGVAIFFGIKRKSARKNPLATIHRADCFGLRQKKFEFLDTHSFETVKWVQITPSAPNYEWVVRDEKTQTAYQKGFSVAELFPVSSVGVVTSRDDFVIDMDKDVLAKRIQDFLASDSAQSALSRFGLHDTLKWKATKALRHSFDETNIVPISYRPFDKRFVYYHDDFIERSRGKIMRHLLSNNLSLVVLRQVKAGDTFQHCFVSNGIVESTLVSNKTSEIDYILPLYLYAGSGGLYQVGETGNISTPRIPNLDLNIARDIANAIGAVYYPVTEYPVKKGDTRLTPEDIFDYIYAVLHSPNYRERYKEFLKIDFPRVPYPKDAKQFETLVQLGRELRELHLLESPKASKLITTYPKEGSNNVEKITYKSGNVFINSTQYFGSVPEAAWNFWIGGYQPAQKWLKDRKGRTLNNADIERYQKVIVALVETEWIMREIDKVAL